MPDAVTASDRPVAGASDRRERAQPLARRALLRRCVLVGAWSFGVTLRAAEDAAAPTASLWQVRRRANGVDSEIRGRILVRAADGGLLLETRDGRLETVTPSELVSAAELEERYRPCDAAELSSLLQSELGAEFETLHTRKYVIATNTTPAYGQYCGELFERLQAAFLTHWKRAGLTLAEPAQPLATVILQSPQQYAEFAAREVGGAIAGSLGFYSARTNRIVIADLTRGTDGEPVAGTSEVARRMESQLANVATIVHEAAHQIAFNCGLHRRYADNPMWLTEGLAMFCEAPDLGSGTGWRTIGKLHTGRLAQFREFAATRRRSGSLTSLVISDDRFRDPVTAADAYAESWALTWLLYQRRRPQYVEFLKRIGARPCLVWDTPEQRQQTFEGTFGADWNGLERELIAMINRLPA